MRKVAASSWVLMLLLAAGCSPGGPEAGSANLAETANASEPASTAAAASPRFASTVPAIRIAATTTLPAAPAFDVEFCDHLFDKPKGEAAKAVAAKGWKITGELSAGRYQAVSFVGGAEPATSGACELSKGNVAFFEGGVLKAIAYGAGKGPMIGRILPTGDGDLRIWDGDIVPGPVADVRISGDGGLAIGKVAAEEKVCGGKAVVPNIYGMPINRARAALQKAGWKPVAAAPEGEDPRLEALVAQGVVEAESCSGTGFGFCAFNYRGPAGTLGVTTVGDGEFPSVSSYGVACG